MHAENYGAIWKHEWINFASSLTQDGSSLLNIQTNLSSALNIANIIIYKPQKVYTSPPIAGHDRIELDLQLHMQLVPITTNVVSSNPARAMCTRYNIIW
jgi:hypothetical protein